MLEFQLRKGHCFPRVLLGVEVGLACVDCVIATSAFVQLARIHSRSSQRGWTRQKVFHLITGSSNFGYFLYLVLTIAATCEDWQFWLPFGFIIMAFSETLFFTAFLLLLSFWIDLCHQANDEDEDEECSSQVTLLERTIVRPSTSSSDGRGRCIPFRFGHVGSRQKIVVWVSTSISVLMVVAALLIWIDTERSLIDEELVAKVSVSLLEVGMLLLGGALAYYGLLICLGMRRVRSESASSEMWKVGGLAVVSPLCFTTSAVIALLPDSPVLYIWQHQHMNSVCASIVLVLFYFIGSSVPSGFLLWIMRELPTPEVASMPQESSTIAFISDRSVTAHHPQQWITAMSSQNQVLRSSPI